MRAITHKKYKSIDLRLFWGNVAKDILTDIVYGAINQSQSVLSCDIIQSLSQHLDNRFFILTSDSPPYYTTLSKFVHIPNNVRDILLDKKHFGL